MKYSVVVPVYNEEESVGELLSEVNRFMSDLKGEFEIVFVNDGSTDTSLRKIQDAQKMDHKVKVISLAVRKGQTNALKEGLKIAQGDIVITLDADLQNDPADIPRLIAKMQEGFDVVCGWRKSRQDTLLKAALSKMGNILQRSITGLKIHDVSCTLRAYQKHCINKIALDWEGQHRFIPLGLSLQGLKVGEIISNHRQRKFGHTKYNHRRIFKVIGDFFKVLKSRGK